jgi:microcystin-dependent protein
MAILFPNNPITEGTTFSPELAELAYNVPVFDGQTQYKGHREKLRDDELSDNPTAVKPRVNSYLDRFKLTYNSGLTFAYQGGSLLLPNGSVVNINPGLIIAPNDQTSFIFISIQGAVTAAPNLPNECFPIAVITTSSGALQGAVTDLRNKAIDRITPASAPSLPPGVVVAYDGDVLPVGWLWCDGAEYNVADFIGLFNAIGYKHGGSGAKFRVEDRRGRVSIGAGQGSGLTSRVVGAKGGLERVALTIPQMPIHSHTLADNGHNHQVLDYGHNHSLNDPGHAHGVYDPGHAHSIFDPGHSHLLPPSATRNNIGSNNENGTGNENVDVWTLPQTTGIGIYAALTGIGIYGAGTNMTLNSSGSNIALNATTSGITMATQGGGESHDNMMPFIVNRYIIKT